jgi:hypothetical protein
MGILAKARAALMSGEMPDGGPGDLRTYTDGSLWVRIAGALSGITSLTQLSTGIVTGYCRPLLKRSLRPFLRTLLDGNPVSTRRWPSRCVSACAQL